MDIQETLKWFEKLSAVKIEKIDKMTYKGSDAAKWVALAETAVRSVFPTQHTIVRRWDVALGAIAKSGVVIFEQVYYVDGVRAVFDAAHELLREGRLRGVLSGIQAQTIDEVLDQAQQLVAEHCVLAAAVLAGGDRRRLLLPVADIYFCRSDPS